VAVYTILTLVRRRGAVPAAGDAATGAERALAAEAPAAVEPPERLARTQPGDAPARVS
jgi:hypothetical protein